MATSTTSLGIINMTSLYAEYPSTTSQTYTNSGTLQWVKKAPDLRYETFETFQLKPGTYLIHVTIAFTSYYNATYNLSVMRGSTVAGYDIGTGEASWDTIRTHSFIVKSTSESDQFSIKFSGAVKAYVGVNTNTSIKNQLLIQKVA